MKKLTGITALVLFMSIITNAQDGSIKSDTFKFRGFEIGLGYFYSGRVEVTVGNEISRWTIEGLSGFFEISGSYKKHIFTLGVSGGSNIPIFFVKAEGFAAFNLYYGREYTIWPWFKVQLDGGFGLISFSAVEIFDRSLTEKPVLGIPIRLKLLAKTGKRISLGVQPAMNFNTIRNTLTTNVVLRYNYAN